MRSQGGRQTRNSARSSVDCDYSLNGFSMKMGIGWVWVLTLSHNVFVDFITSFKPLSPVRTRETALLCQPKTTIKRNPEHYFGVGVILLSAPNFPDGHIRFCIVLAKNMQFEFGLYPSRWSRHNLQTCQPRTLQRLFAYLPKISRTATHCSHVTGLPYLL